MTLFRNIKTYDIERSVLLADVQSDFELTDFSHGTNRLKTSPCWLCFRPSVFWHVTQPRLAHTHVSVQTIGPEISVTNHRSTLRNIPEGRRPHLYRGESLKSRTVCPCLSLWLVLQHLNLLNLCNLYWYILEWAVLLKKNKTKRVKNILDFATSITEPFFLCKWCLIDRKSTW